MSEQKDDKYPPVSSGHLRYSSYVEHDPFLDFNNKVLTYEGVQDGTGPSHNDSIWNSFGNRKVMTLERP